MTTGDRDREQVRSAAVALLADETRNRWKLARSVEVVVPAEDRVALGRVVRAGSPREEGTSVADRLANLAEWLTEQGVETPDGTPYTPASLANLREMAMIWNPAEVHPEAAYRTHEEAGGRDSLGRVVLSALCAVARGERGVLCPEGVAAAPWEDAKTRVLNRKKRLARAHRQGYLVVANDVRIALLRRTNNVGRPTTKGDLSKTLESDPDLAREFAEAVIQQAPEVVAEVLLNDPVAGKAARKAVHEEDDEAEEAVDGPQRGELAWHDPSDGPYWDSIQVDSLRHAIISYGRQVEDALGNPRRLAYLSERGEENRERLSAFVDVSKGFTAADFAKLFREEE